MVPSSAPSGGNVKALEDIAQRLDELVVIIGHIKDDIKEYTKGLGVEEAPAMEEAAPAQNEQAPSAAPAEEETPSFESSVMNDAIAQINNMVIPDASTPSLEPPAGPTL